MPAENFVVNLPPWLRYKVNNVLISALIPSHLSATSQRKYFKQMCIDDFNLLITDGIPCPSRPGKRIKVKIFGQTLDLKGREKFLDQISVQGYMGCSHCIVYFPKGAASTGACYAVARTYLQSDDPLRQQSHLAYEFPAAEADGPTNTNISFTHAC